MDSTHNGSAKELTCFHYGKKGHIKAKCFKYQKGNNKGQVRGAILVRAGESESETESLSEVRGLIGHKSNLDDFKWYGSVGSVLLPGCSKEVKVKILRDTACVQLLILETTLPEDMVAEGRESVLLGGFPDSVVACPLVTVRLDSSLIKGPVKVVVVKTLPVKGIDFLLGNYLAQNKLSINPIIVYKPEEEKVNCNFLEEIFPVSAVTRSKSKIVCEEEDLGIEDLFVNSGKVSGKEEEECIKLELKETERTREAFLKEQKKDAAVANLLNLVGRRNKEGDKYVMESDILCRKFMPSVSSKDETWKAVNQIVVPMKYQEGILRKDHEDLFAGHLGIDKTFSKVCRNFFWPGFKKDVKRHCKTCHDCQIAGKPNQTIPKAPLSPIPSVVEPFEHILVDIVGPWPKSTEGGRICINHNG